MERKYDFDLLKRTRRSFLWTKSSGALTEVAIFSPGYSQLPTMNAFFVSISENPHYNVSITTQRAVIWVSVLQNLHQQV